MAACNVDTLAASSGCWMGPASTPHKQRIYLAYLYLLWGQEVGADVPGAITEAPDFAKCWQNVGNDQLRAFEILAVIGGINVTSPLTITPDQIMAEGSCIDQMTDAQLDRLIGSLKCSLFQSLGAP